MDDLAPVTPMTVLRTHEVSLSSALEVAEQGRHAFVLEKGQIVALEAISKNEKEPRAEVMFADQQARVDPNDPLFFASIVERGADGAPALSRVQMRVVAQLRSPYASRLLHSAGVHASRIGVDFVAAAKRDA